MTALSQTDSLAGVYENKQSFDDGMQVDYELSLHVDGTFLYHFYQDQLCYVEDNRAQGTWTAQSDTIYFATDSLVHIDDYHDWDFDGAKGVIDSGVFRLVDCSEEWLIGTELKRVKR